MSLTKNQLRTLAGMPTTSDGDATLSEAVAKNSRIMEGSEQIEVHFSPKSPGALDDIFVLDGTANISKLADALGIPDGWELTAVGPIWAAFNSGDRLVFFKNKNDYHPDEDMDDEDSNSN